MSSSEYYPGRRLSFSTTLCTVRYVGPVEGTKGDWLGVEWDEPSRGKHDGSHKDVRYFECRSTSATAASFIRPSRTSDQPASFFEALKKKYASTSAEDITATANEIHISGKTVEEVGFEKIRQQLAELQELRIVVLDGACIAYVDSDLDKRNLKIVELDLSRNLLESWYDITAICNSLDFLRRLRLDGNTLSRPQDPFKNDETHETYQRLKELSLNNLAFPKQTAAENSGNLSWEFIVNFTSMFPSLATLSLASNNLTEMRLPLKIQHLTNLDLSSNDFTSLENIRPLTALPNLQTLSLRSNPLISLSSPQDKSTVFPKLKHLDLKSTLLPTLSSLNPIPISFPHLTSLLTNDTPLTSYPSASLHTIARLATLTELNYSHITPPERQNAELYYLNQISKQLAAATDAAEEHNILQDQPRWKDLCTLHGEPTNPIKPPNTEPPGAGTLAARVTAFTFHITHQDLEKAQKHAQTIAGHSSEGGTLEPNIPDTPTTDPLTIYSKTKLIPRTVSTYSLKGIAAALFAIRPLSVKLIYEMEEWDPVGRGEGGDAGGWSVSEDESGEEEEVDGEGQKKGRKGEGMKKQGREREREGWVRREVELVGGTREVGFFVEGREASVRIEVP
ncbi:hypothetical protein BDR22DRAFT_818671 [Usnea florida]